MAYDGFEEEDVKRLRDIQRRAYARRLHKLRTWDLLVEAAARTVSVPNEASIKRLRKVVEQVTENAPL